MFRKNLDPRWIMKFWKKVFIEIERQNKSIHVEKISFFSWLCIFSVNYSHIILLLFFQNKYPIFLFIFLLLFLNIHKQTTHYISLSTLFILPQSELSSLQDRFETDFAIWKREHESSYKRREVEREETIRQQCRMERDRQIDSIVARVDAEQIKNQQEFEMKMM